MSGGIGLDRTRPRAMTGLALHILFAPLYLFIGILTSLWTALALWTLWTAMLALALAQRRNRPLIAALLPLIDLGIWVLAVLAGSV